MRSCAWGLLPAYAFPKQAAPAFSRGHWFTDKRITRLCNRVRRVTPTNKETRVIWAVCSSTREDLNRYSFRANHALRSAESPFSDNLNNKPGLRWKPQRLPGWKQHSISQRPDSTDKRPHYSRPFHGIWANGKLPDWDTFLQGPKVMYISFWTPGEVCTTLSKRIRRETMNESEFQNIIAQQIIKCIGAKHSFPA